MSAGNIGRPGGPRSLKLEERRPWVTRLGAVPNVAVPVGRSVSEVAVNAGPLQQAARNAGGVSVPTANDRRVELERAYELKKNEVIRQDSAIGHLNDKRERLVGERVGLGDQLAQVDESLRKIEALIPRSDLAQLQSEKDALQASVSDLQQELGTPAMVQLKENALKFLAEKRNLQVMYDPFNNVDKASLPPLEGVFADLKRRENAAYPESALSELMWKEVRLKRLEEQISNIDSEIVNVHAMPKHIEMQGELRGKRAALMERSLKLDEDIASVRGQIRAGRDQLRLLEQERDSIGVQLKAAGGKE